MSIGIVIKFKIIQIHHSHAGRTLQISDLILIISSIKNTCKSVFIQFIRISTEFCKKILSVF